MITLITGGADSGKSEYAERLITSEAGDKKKIYLATMKRSKAARDRIERHVKRRAKMGFVTMECGDGLMLPPPLDDAFLLFEDIPNYVANTMFSGKYEGMEGHDLKSRMIEELRGFLTWEGNIYFVTCDVASAGNSYGEVTVLYMRILGSILQYIGAHSDRVIEVIAGIPCIIKKS